MTTPKDTRDGSAGVTVMSAEIWIPHLAELLFVREAWQLRTTAQIPALDPRPATGTSRLPEEPPRPVWESRWDVLWDSTWDWYRGAHQGLRAGRADTIPERWSGLYGTEGLDQKAAMAWEEIFLTLSEQSVGWDFREWQESDAARNGLRHVLVLPYRGYFASYLNASDLALSTETLLDPVLFARAREEWNAVRTARS